MNDLAGAPCTKSHRPSLEGFFAISVLTANITKLVYMQEDLGRELDNLLDQQTQMDVRMATFQQLLYGHSSSIYDTIVPMDTHPSYD